MHEPKPVPPLDWPAFNAGKAAYRAGVSVGTIYERHMDDYRRANEARDGEEHRTIEAAAKSYVLGFIEGVIDDIRTNARGRGGMKA